MGRTHANEELQSLKELMTMLCDKECEESIRLTGLKVIRAIIYLNPDEDSLSVHNRDTEFELMLQNKPPSLLGNTHFAFTQAQVAKLGAVEVVATCIESENPEIIMATLRLAVTLLDGGNPKVRVMVLLPCVYVCRRAIAVVYVTNILKLVWQQVQEQFAATLLQQSSQSFFIKFRGLFHESVAAIRVQKQTVLNPLDRVRPRRVFFFHML